MIKLYHFEACPYCVKVRFALEHLGIPWEGVTIDPADRAGVREVSGQNLVPVIDDDGKVVADSTRILNHVAEEHDATLKPREARNQGLASLMEDWADEALGPMLRRWVSEGDEAPREKLFQHVDEMLESLDEALRDKLLLVGDELSYADISVYAFLAGLPDEERQRITEPYVSLRDWYLNIADYHEKSQASGAGGFSQSPLTDMS